MSVDRLAHQFARELASVAGTPHVGADPLAVALEVAGDAPAVVAVDSDPALDRIASALAGAGHEVIRPSEEAWTHRIEAARLGVTRCAAALCDTGTLLLAFGPDRPRATSLVPRVHLAIVTPEDLVPSLADALARLPNPLPSGVALVTGPSRSGDIEQIITLGVHGPQAVHVVLAAPDSEGPRSRAGGKFRAPQADHPQE